MNDRFQWAYRSTKKEIIKGVIGGDKKRLGYSKTYEGKNNAKELVLIPSAWHAFNAIMKRN